MSTPIQGGSRCLKRRSLGLSRKWSSPTAPAEHKSSIVGLAFGQGPSPLNSSHQEKSSPVFNSRSPRSALPLDLKSKTTPSRLVSRFSRKRSFKTTFKSPMKEVDSGTTKEEESDDVQQEITNLKKQVQLMKEEEDGLRKCGYKEEELQMHIEKLHEYNELKDTGQMLIGKIATLEGRTTKEMYAQFGLNLED
ncbi:DNA repair protein SWI5 homolog [Anneissia japonica]|uniref:DNA repair protein SWI5 homolog n=1 Tax=Anneissia japonica TaxID=1529436 RepID=UPI0014256358|nr:DNA repair protein SWI5 homolog [Anneissia japonica]